MVNVRGWNPTTSWFGKTSRIGVYYKQEQQQLEGNNCHNLSCLFIEQHLTLYHRAGLITTKRKIIAKKLELLKTIYVISGDKFGQKWAEYMSPYDIIPFHINNANIFIGVGCCGVSNWYLRPYKNKAITRVPVYYLKLYMMMF